MKFFFVIVFISVLNKCLRYNLPMNVERLRDCKAWLTVKREHLYRRAFSALNMSYMTYIGFYLWFFFIIIPLYYLTVQAVWLKNVVSFCCLTLAANFIYDNVFCTFLRIYLSVLTSWRDAWEAISHFFSSEIIFQTFKAQKDIEHDLLSGKNIWFIEHTSNFKVLG